MRLLLDTHVYLWWLRGDRRLPARFRAAIEDPRATVHVSAASLWEAAIKAALGKLDLQGIDLAAEIAASGFVELPINGRHAQRAGELPPHHADPFDRMLVAQAELEGLVLATTDERLRAYDVAFL